MDLSQSNAAKSQRNPRNRKKLQENESETSRSVNKKGCDPQPQRANRRQQNEPSKNSKASETVPAVVQEKKETAESVTVDHSNLKRETEEIAKLTKKFTKREISSNWHRYSAPESNEIHQQQTERDAPADFSDLLQVPVSKGGHLQLKEEKAWSSASSQQLSGYFALDLKLLSQSLACLPLYDQLCLPKHIFSEEEIKQFDAVADEAKKCYNPEKAEDTSFKVKSLPSLVRNESCIEETLGTEINLVNSEDLNILDVKQNTNKEISLIVEREQCISKQQTLIVDNIKIDTTGLTETVSLSKKPDPIISGKKGGTVEVNKGINLDIDRMFELEKDLSKVNLTERLVRGKSSEKQIIFPQTVTDNKTNKFEITLALNDTSIVKSQTLLSKELANTIKESNVQYNSSIGDNISQNPSESKEQRIRKSKYKSPDTQVNTNKLGGKFNILNYEDDDLDFLLSLKAPVPEEPRAESKPAAAVKETVLYPAETVKTQPVIFKSEKRTELDDWLDSILDD